MNKKMKKISCFALLAIMATANIMGTGCARESGPTIDTTKTQIYVGNYNGGLGDAWLRAVADAFEADYADYELNGKTGIQVIINNQKELYSGEVLIDSIAGNSNEVFFTEKVDLPSYMSRNLLLDISDVVETDLGEVAASEAGTTIASKMTTQLNDYVQKNDNYYALPFYEGFYSFVYNVDVFDKYGFYFKENYYEETYLEDKFIDSGADFIYGTEDDGAKSVGPDGVSGTKDDGLPETYEDFYDLCDYMVLCSVAPIVWPGKQLHYWTRLMFNLWADYEGAEQMLLNFTLDGDATSLVDVNDGVVTPVGTTEIKADGSNAALLQKQAGKYYALQFINELAKHPSWFKKYTDSGTQSHTSSQQDIIFGAHDSQLETVGILVDGNWFESEATEAFKTAAVEYTSKASKENSKFAVMPMPKVSRDRLGKSTYLGTNNSFCFVNANCASYKTDLVKTFVKYCHTNKALNTFTQYTGMARPFTYSIDDSLQLTYFAQASYDIHTKSDVVYPYSSNSFFLSNSSVFATDNWGFTSIVNGNAYKNPYTSMKNDSSLTAEKYFNGMYAKHSAALG